MDWKALKCNFSAQNTGEEPGGFSLIEVMVAAGVLVVSALGTAFMLKGKPTGELYSLKSCQDINEEILVQIDSVGRGEFAYVFGASSDQNFRHCPASMCPQAELGLDRNARWPASEPLTTPDDRPVVRPHSLKLSSINYLLGLYNSQQDYCKGFSELPDGDYNILGAGAKNYLKSRARLGDIELKIEPIYPNGQPAGCPAKIDIRPAAAGVGDNTPATEFGVVDTSSGAVSYLGLRVHVRTTYRNPNSEQDSDLETCSARKDFFYQPESYRGHVSSNVITAPPTADITVTPPQLPTCLDPLVMEFKSTFGKAKRDSVFLCRERSELGSFPEPAYCDPSNPSAGYCKCEDTCPNTWPEFPSSVEPVPTFTDPNGVWFPCDQLPEHFVDADIISNLNDAVVKFDPAGNGTLTIEVLDVKRDAPKKIRVDVIEVDSALNSSADQPAATPGEEFATLKADFFGQEPGNAVCEDCSNLGTYKFMCLAAGDSCPTCCDSTTTCCPGDSFPSNPNCPDPNPPPDDDENLCDGKSGQELTCCEAGHSEGSVGWTCCMDPSDDACGACKSCDYWDYYNGSPMTCMLPRPGGGNPIKSVITPKLRKCDQWSSSDPASPVCPGQEEGCGFGTYNICSCEGEYYDPPKEGDPCEYEQLGTHWSISWCHQKASGETKIPGNAGDQLFVTQPKECVAGSPPHWTYLGSPQYENCTAKCGGTCTPTGCDCP